MTSTKTINVVNSVAVPSSGNVPATNDDEEEEESVVNSLVHEMSRALETVLPNNDILPTPSSGTPSKSSSNTFLNFFKPSTKTTAVNAKAPATTPQNKDTTLSAEKLIEQEYDMKLRQKIRQYFNNIEVSDEVFE